MKITLGFQPTLIQSIKYKFSKKYRKKVGDWIDNINLNLSKTGDKNGKWKL